jgi:membrane-associated protease RseP (regulator of RpoE activity)
MDIFPFLLGVIIFLIGLSLSIGLHELGHLIPAKIFKVRVAQYMIGFGPTLSRKKWGETEYGIKALPLGG